MLPGQHMHGPDAADADTYGALADRAYSFLQAAGGRVSEEALLRRVFSAPAASPFWHRLLAQVLGDSTRFRRLPEGAWALAGGVEDERPLWELDGVVLSLMATGLKPWRHRLLEIAALRVQQGTVVETFARLLNPQKRLPRYLAERTGIAPAMLAEAPTFAQIVEEVCAFLGSDLLVGHNLGFDLAFLQYELRRLGRPGLTNEIVDTVPVVTRLLPDIGKPSLDNLAASWGLPRPRYQRALAQARLVAEAWPYLWDLARAQGIETLGQLRTLLSATPAAIALRQRPLLERDFWHTLPEKPGVYLMKGAGGEVLYVGKAKNLRQRLSAYYSEALSYTRRMEGLLDAFRKVEAVVVGSELEASLLESRLIRQHRPRFNTQQRRSRPAAFLKIGWAMPYPKLSPGAAPASDGAQYLGPFRRATTMRDALQVVAATFGLHTCPRTFQKRRPPCLRLGQGLCLGPCTGQLTSATYRSLVAQAVGFLEGEREAGLERLAARIREAAERGDVARAERLRQLLERARALPAADQLFAGGPVPRYALIVQPSAAEGAIELFMVREGLLWRQERLGADDPALPDRVRQLLEEYAAAPPLPLTAEAAEESAIVTSWLTTHPQALLLPHPAGPQELGAAESFLWAQLATPKQSRGADAGG